MRRMRIPFWLFAPLFAVLLSGCGGITAAGLMQKGGMWLAKEAVKKGVKEFREKDENGSKHDETSRGRKSDRKSQRKQHHESD